MQASTYVMVLGLAALGASVSRADVVKPAPPPGGGGVAPPNAKLYETKPAGGFKPYVAGFYARKYLGEMLTREEVDARMDELLALERAALGMQA